MTTQARSWSSTDKIAEKFIAYYWRQTLPFLGKETLRQNTGRPPVVVTLLLQVRNEHGDRLAEAKRDAAKWRRLVRSVSDNIREMPLPRLQNVGRGTLPFLYNPPAVKVPAVIRLYPGVAFCLRRFHGLVAELVQAAWTRWVRQQNLSIIGDTADLHEFLFGVERANLALLQKPLRDLQRNTCFYCHHEMRGRSDVDHFVPWVLYQLDLGHNFVLAHKECNSEKRDRLASEEHLAAWVDRNQKHGAALGREFDRLRVLHSLPSTIQIARWAYGSVSMADGLTWKARETLVPLRGDWARFLA